MEPTVITLFTPSYFSLTVTKKIFILHSIPSSVQLSSCLYIFKSPLSHSVSRKCNVVIAGTCKYRKFGNIVGDKLCVKCITAVRLYYNQYIYIIILLETSYFTHQTLYLLLLVLFDLVFAILCKRFFI